MSGARIHAAGKRRVSTHLAVCGCLVTIAACGACETPTERSGRFVTTAAYAAEDAAPVEDRSAARASRAPLDELWPTIKRDLHDFPAAIWDDTKAVYGEPTNLLILGVGYGASLTLQKTGVDRTVEGNFQERRDRRFGRDGNLAINTAGNPAVHFAAAGLWYVIGQQTGDEKTYEVGTKLFRALTVNGLSVMLGQLASFEAAPNGEWGTFPSGHTSSTFAMAAVLDHEYGPWVGIPMYGLAGLVGYARLDDDEHYLSDVVMGGVMGLVIGHTIAHDNQPPELLGGSIVPYVNPESGATGLAWRFPIPNGPSKR